MDDCAMFGEVYDTRDRGYSSFLRAVTWPVYHIWERNVNDKVTTPWRITTHTVKARTDKEAQSRMRRKFAKAGFHSMSMIACKAGDSPNT